MKSDATDEMPERIFLLQPSFETTGVRSALGRDELFDVSRGTLIAGGAAVLLGVVLTLTAE